jgi:hypothetical protein
MSGSSLDESSAICFYKPMTSKSSRKRKRKYNWGWQKGHDLGLRLAIRAAGKKAGADPERITAWGKKWLAEGLGIKVQSINHWRHIPSDRLLMVHMLTGVPLSKLNPRLFK